MTGIELLAVKDILKNIEGRDWQIPRFQRDYVWQRGQVKALVESMLGGRPVGLITLWERPAMSHPLLNFT